MCQALLQSSLPLLREIRNYFWSVFSYIQSEYRKIRTKNNSVFGHFSRSALLPNENFDMETLCGISNGKEAIGI